MDFEQLKAALADVFIRYNKEIITVYLFGSTANGAQSTSSSLDFALTYDDNASGSALKFSLYGDQRSTLKRNYIDIMSFNSSGTLIIKPIDVCGNCL